MATSPGPKIETKMVRRQMGQTDFYTRVWGEYLGWLPGSPWPYIFGRVVL